MKDAKELYKRIFDEREDILAELNNANHELDLEKGRKVMLFDLKRGMLGGEAKDNKYIISDYEDAEKNISKLEHEITEHREKYEALSYQLEYLKVRVM